MEKWSNLLSIQTLGEAMSLAKKAQAARGSGLTEQPQESPLRKGWDESGNWE